MAAVNESCYTSRKHDRQQMLMEKWISIKLKVVGKCHPTVVIVSIRVVWSCLKHDVYLITVIWV